jgi:hypothetical protein
MVELRITRTSKSFNPRDRYTEFDSEVKTFTDLAEAKAWLKSEYGDHKRDKIYQDGRNPAMHVGYIYGFKNRDISHNSAAWLQQDWITFYEVTREVIEL